MARVHTRESWASFTSAGSNQLPQSGPDGVGVDAHPADQPEDGHALVESHQHGPDLFASPWDRLEAAMELIETRGGLVHVTAGRFSSQSATAESPSAT